MEKAQILETLTSVMEDIFDTENLQVTETTTAEDIEDWDSLNHVQLVVATEKKFKVRFTTAEIQSWKKVGDIVESIHAKLN